MNMFTKKKLVSSLIATLAISSLSLNAADYGSVNGDAITNEDIATILRNPGVDFSKLPKNTQDKVLDQVVEKKLLTENAAKSGVEKDEAYKNALEKLKKDLALEIWMQKELKNVTVSDKDAKDFYDKNKDKFKVPATLEASHILTKTEADAKAVIKELDKAKDIKTAFADLAKSKSVGPSGPKGGYLGKFAENQMVPEFSAAAKALSVGKYSKSPVKTQFGYHVIYLQDKKGESTLEYDKVKDRIKQMVLQNNFQAHVKKIVDGLRSKAKIVIK